MAITMNGAYFNGLDLKDGLKIPLANIPGSVTTDYILFSLNVASPSSADINFGLTGPLLATAGKVTPEVDHLLGSVVRLGVSEGKCQRVWLSIGGWGLSAFANIQAILNTGGTLKSTLMANFGAIVQAVGIPGVQAVGFDMDYEEDGTLASLVANVTIALYETFQCPVTFCPFQDELSWIGALQQVYAKLKIQPVVGYNLQIYSGGSKNDPTRWAANIAKTPKTGVANPAAFVWPIVSCDPNAAPPPPLSPTQVVQKLQGWGSKGASLWAAASLSSSSPPTPPDTLSDYSRAIAKGIG